MSMQGPKKGRSRSASFGVWLSKVGKEQKHAPSPEECPDAARAMIPRLHEGGVDFNVKYFGSMPVEKGRGSDMAREASESVRDKRGKSSHKKPMILRVSTEGIRLIDAESKQEVDFHKVHRISQCARDKNNKRHISYVAYNSAAKSYLFHMFSVSHSEGGEDQAKFIVSVIGQAFSEVYKQHQEEKRSASRSNSLEEPVVEKKAATRQTSLQDQPIREMPEVVEACAAADLFVPAPASSVAAGLQVAPGPVKTRKRGPSVTVSAAPEIDPNEAAKFFPTSGASSSFGSTGSPAPPAYDPFASAPAAVAPAPAAPTPMMAAAPTSVPMMSAAPPVDQFAQLSFGMGAPAAASPYPAAAAAVQAQPAPSNTGNLIDF